jgi:hypothetical protein
MKSPIVFSECENRSVGRDFMEKIRSADHYAIQNPSRLRSSERAVHDVDDHPQTQQSERAHDYTNTRISR